MTLLNVIVLMFASLVVGIGLGYGFRGLVGRKLRAVGDKIKSKI